MTVAPRLLLLALALTASCTSGGAATPASPADTAVRARPVAAALQTYGSCARLRQSVRREALDEVTAYGLPSDQRLFTRGGPLLRSAAPQPFAAAADSALSFKSAYSGTTVQEKGVDEPDTVKTDGRLLLVVQPGPVPVLRVLDVTGEAPRLVGQLVLPGSSPELLLVGPRVVVLDAAGGDTTAQVVDLRDPASPVVERTFTLPGHLLASRLVHGRVVLATTSNPSVRTTYPLSGRPVDVRQALLVNRRAVAAVADTDYLPAVMVQPGGRSFRPACAAALHPGVPSGLGTTSLVTLDPAADAPTQTTTVIGTPNALYASADEVWLATSRWGSTAETDLHGFGITDPDALVRLGSGTVPGTLLDEYALSAAHGDLRVATTVPATLDNRVTVLRPRGGVLEAVGTVAGLGKGERIVGVRFVGDLAYVVTFRQVDPLYVVDLADGAAPRLRGELELPGFSSTLYPLGKDRLLGVGQQGGLQLSTFDVADPDAPRLEDREVLVRSSSPAERDHHALLWWPDAALVALPVYTYTGAPETVVYRVADDGQLTEAARIRPQRGAPSRAVVVGDLLYSVTPNGLATNRLDELSTQAWTPFP